MAYALKAYEVPLSSRIAKGTPIPQILTIKTEEKVTSIFSIDQFHEKESIVLLSRLGLIKKFPLSMIQSLNARGLTVIRLKGEDSLKWVRRCKEGDDLLIATR